MLISTSLATFLSLSSFIGLGSAGYTLKDDYSGSGFFDKFDFFTDTDPTQGYVDYVSQSDAQGAKLINTDGGKAYMGVDYTNVASGRGRKSLRMTSKAAYTHALIVLDLEHMPGSTCGVWPAFWTLGSNWPGNGEIDIIEGVNTQTSNDMTLHTGDNCAMSSSSNAGGSAYSGKLGTSNCFAQASDQPDNAGCQISASSSNSYGDGFNSAGGGVYATEWTSDFIRIWFFPRGSAPSDVSSSNPDPSKWGTPTAYFGNSGCDIDSHFKNHKLVFDTTFCGQWAGSVWSSNPTCSAKASKCEDYVMNNPGDFKESYWSVNSLKVYQSDSAKRSEPIEASTNSTLTPTLQMPTMSSALANPTLTVPLKMATTKSALMNSTSTPARKMPAMKSAFANSTLTTAPTTPTMKSTLTSTAFRTERREKPQKSQASGLTPTSSQVRTRKAQSTSDVIKDALNRRLVKNRRANF